MIRTYIPFQRVDFISHAAAKLIGDACKDENIGAIILITKYRSIKLLLEMLASQPFLILDSAEYKVNNKLD